MYIVISGLALGFLLDLLLGDPQGLPHPIVWIGKFISALEKRLIMKKNKTRAGAILVLFVCAVSFFLPFAILFFCYLLSPWLCFVVHALMCYQIFAMKCLAKEANYVQKELTVSLEKGRVAVARIVGRDTSSLSKEGVLKATVETVAENTTDGVIAPMLYMALGGAPLAFLYKAINTMDSMVGYKNEKYLDFGKVAAKTDDVANFLPARITAGLMIVTSFLLGQDFRAAARIWKRDKRKHQSPNSAQTEAVCAGALGVQLAGDAVYFGKRCKKPFIGDKKKEIDVSDIQKASHLMLGTAFLGLGMVLTLWMTVLIVI